MYSCMMLFLFSAYRSLVRVIFCGYPLALENTLKVSQRYDATFHDYGKRESKWERGVEKIMSSICHHFVWCDRTHYFQNIRIQTNMFC